MKLWKALSAGLITAIIISLVVYNLDRMIGLDLTGGCLVVNSLSMHQLNAKAKSLYLVSSKRFPIVNSCYASHWSVIVETDIGLFNVSISRYMSVYIYHVYKNDIFSFDGNGKWESKYYILKHYPLKDEYVENPVTIYDIAQSAMAFYNGKDDAMYSLFNHNCQHVSQYIIHKFGKVDPDDELLVKYKGKPLFSKSISDVFNGPKIMF